MPFLLYARAARYYSPAIFFATVCWFLSLDLSTERVGKLTLFVIASVFFFHTNYVIFAAFFGALAAWTLIFPGRKKRLAALAWSLLPIACLTLPWYVWVKPHRGSGPYLLANLWRGNPFYLFYGHMRDFNIFGFFPALMLIPLFIVGARLWKQSRLMAGRLWGVVAFILLFVFAMSLISPQVLLRNSYVDIRYASLLLPAFALVMGILCYEILRYNKALGTGLIVIALFTDLLTLRQFLPNYQQMVRLSSPLPLPFNSYLADHVYEVTHHRATPDEVVTTWLSGRIKAGETAITSPSDSDSPLIFYLGDRFRFCGQLQEEGSGLLPKWRDKLPQYVYSGQIAPDWIVYFTRQGIRPDIAEWIERNGVKYELLVLPAFGVDMSRPELPMRTFKEIPPPRPEDHILIRRRTAPVPAQAQTNLLPQPASH